MLEKRGDPTALEAEDANKSTFIMALMPRGINPLKDVRGPCIVCVFRRLQLAPFGGVRAASLLSQTDEHWLICNHRRPPSAGRRPCTGGKFCQQPKAVVRAALS